MDEREKLQRLLGRLYSFLDEAAKLKEALEKTPEADLPQEARNSPSSAYGELRKQLFERGAAPEFPEECTTIENAVSLIAELEAELS